MSRDFLALSFGFAVLIAATRIAQAEPGCGAHDDIARQLADRYGESRQTMGLSDDNALIELYASDATGTWTLLVTRPGGPTCLAAAGGDFQRLAEDPPRPGRGT